MPIWAALLAWLLLGEPLTPRRLIALVLGLLGIAVLVGGQGMALGLVKLPGIALGLAAAILFALGAVHTKRAPIAMRPVPLVAWQVGLGCLPLLVAGLALEAPRPGALTSFGWTAMAYMAIGPLAVCYLSWFAALRRLPAGVAAMGTLLTPVIGVLGGALALGEGLGLREVAALGLTLAGIALVLRD
jgi:drug/metabolite transporter (DMT)-like permease